LNLNASVPAGERPNFRTRTAHAEHRLSQFAFSKNSALSMAEKEWSVARGQHQLKLFHLNLQVEKIK
jgi:hypothetical protein